MTFIARLKQNSSIWHRWCGEARTGGFIHGVHFIWEPGNIYRSEPLTTEQITSLQAHSNVILEVASVDTTPVASPADVPVARTEKPVAATAPTRVNSTPPGRRG